MALLLTDEVIRQTVTMDAMVDAVEELHRRYALGEATNVERRSVFAGESELALMGGALLYEGLFGSKTYTTTVDGDQHYHVTLYEAASGRLQAFVHANWLGALRTGATTGVAVRHMANPGPSVFGMIGAGYHAQTQMMAVAAVRDLSEIRVFSRRPEPRAAFAANMAMVLGRDVNAVDSSREAVEGSDIVVCMTNTREPVLDGSWLKGGALLVSGGPVTLDRQEVDETSIRRASMIVVDSLEAAPHEAGELVAAVEKGLISWDQVVELRRVVAGLAPGRQSPNDNIFVKHFGIGVVDIAAAKLAYDIARERGFGQELDI